MKFQYVLVPVSMSKQLVTAEEIVSSKIENSKGFVEDAFIKHFDPYTPGKYFQQ